MRNPPPTSNRVSRIALLVVAMSVPSAVACGGSDETNGNGAGVGSAGKGGGTGGSNLGVGGRAGQAGTAGVGGAAGSVAGASGKGGSAGSAAGNAGQSGSAGSGGDPGKGGSAGSGGAAGSDAGGAAGVGGAAGDGGAAGAGGGGNALVLAPLYAATGPFWNDYVKADGTDRFTATGAACDGATDGPTYDACIHAGELRAGAIPGRTACTGLTATDSLGAFEWACFVKDGQAWITSSRLAKGKHLADLIDFAGSAWKPLSVTVSEGATTVSTSAPAVLWTNPIRDVPTGTDTAVPHDVLITRAGGKGSIGLLVEKVAYVTEPGTTFEGQVGLRGNFLWGEAKITGGFFTLGEGGFLVIRGADVRNFGGVGVGMTAARAGVVEDVVTVGNGNSTGATFHVNGGKISRVTTGGGTSHSLHGILIGNANGAPMTGATFEDLTDTGSGRGVYLRAVADSTFKNLRSVQAEGVTNNDGGIEVASNASGNTLENLVVEDPKHAGLYVYGSTSTYRHVRVTRPKAEGLVVRNSNQNVLAFGNRFEDVRVAETPKAVYGLYITASFTVMQNVFVSGSDRPIILDGGSQNIRLANVYATGGDTLFQQANTSSGGGMVAQNLTLAGAQYDATVNGSRGAGYVSDGTAQKLVNNLLVINTERGLTIEQSNTGPRFHDAVLVGSTGEAIRLLTTNRVQLDGTVKLGRDGAGSVCNVAPSAVGMTDTCQSEAPSTATITAGHLATGITVGAVTDDAANTGDTAGQVLHAPTLDWMSFDNPSRTWGRSEGDQRGRCLAGTTCQIFDFSLRATDTVARNIAGLPTGNDFLVSIDRSASAAPADAAACEKDSPGSTFVAGTPNRCESTFLRSAVEVLFDGIGDDDNLCESGETCVFSPNAGAYQGHGALVSAGAFVDGKITGVTLVKYENNGR